MNCQIPYTMKKLFLFLIALFSLYAATATEQYPDIIEYGKKKYELYVDWGHPSPLQTLYIRTNTESPFKGYSTANYRGHIATWRIRDGKLYLVSVNTQKQYGRTGTYFPVTTTIPTQQLRLAFSPSLRFRKLLQKATARSSPTGIPACCRWALPSRKKTKNQNSRATA